MRVEDGAGPHASRLPLANTAEGWAMSPNDMESDRKCPVTGGSHERKAVGAMSNRDWWPNQLNLRILNQNSPLSGPD